MTKTVIMGIGNELLADEGVGVHAARQLMTRELPANTTVLDTGTNLLDALPSLQNAGRIIVLDAMMADEPPGTVYRTTMNNCQCPTTIASMHGFDISRLLALAGNHSRCEVVILGVEPEEITWSMDLSATVSAALPHLVAAAVCELNPAATVSY